MYQYSYSTRAAAAPQARPGGASVDTGALGAAHPLGNTTLYYIILYYIIYYYITILLYYTIAL